MATDRIDTAASEGTESLGPQSSATAEQYSYGEVHSHLNAEHEASYGNLNMSEAPASHDNDQSNSVRKRPLQSSSPCEQNSLSEPDSPELRPMSNKRVKYVRSASDVSEDQDPHGGVNIVTRAGETYEMQERELDTGSEESRNSTGQSLPGESESSGESDESDDSDNSKESHQSDESDDTRTPPALPPYNDSSDDHSDTHPHDDFNSSSEWDHDSEGNRMPWGSCILRPEERPGYESSHATSDEDSAAESISASEHASDDMSEAGVSIYASLIQLDIPRYSSTRQAFTSSATSSPHLQMSPSMGYGSPERAVFSSPIFAFPPEDEILGDESSRRSSPGRTHEEFRALSDMMDEEVGIDMIQGVRHQQTNIDFSNGSNEDDQAMRGPIGGTASSEQVEMDAEERGDTLHRMEKGYARRHNADRGANVEVFNASDPWPRQYHTPIKGKANLLQYKLAMPDIDEVASGFTPFAAKVTKNPKLMVIPKFKSDTKSNIEFDKEGGRDYGGTESDSDDESGDFDISNEGEEECSKTGREDNAKGRDLDCSAVFGTEPNAAGYRGNLTNAFFGSEMAGIVIEFCTQEAAISHEVAGEMFDLWHIQLPVCMNSAFDRPGPKNPMTPGARMEVVAGVAGEVVQHILTKNYGLTKQLAIIASWRSLVKQVHSRKTLGDAVSKHPAVTKIELALEKELKKLLHESA